jgi:hypothetical protein
MELSINFIGQMKLTNLYFRHLKPYFKKKQIHLSHIRTYTNIDQ